MSDFDIWAARGAEHLSALRADWQSGEEARERMAADVMNRAFSELSADAAYALDAPWPDLADYEAACPDLEDTQHAPMNPRGAPDLDFFQITHDARVAEWGAPTTAHIEALEQAVRRLNWLLWPYTDPRGTPRGASTRP